MNALTPAGLAASSSLSSVSALAPRKWPVSLFPHGQHPAFPPSDAALIAASKELGDKLDAYNRSDDENDGPIREALDQVIVVIENTRPVTLAGVVAKARAAQTEVLKGGDQPEITLSKNEGAAWSWHLVNDLIRLADAVQLQGVLSATEPDATLLRLGEQFEAAWKTETAAWYAKPYREKRAQKLNAVTGEIVDEIKAIPATTHAGVLVKVRAMRWCRSDAPVKPETFTLEDENDPTTAMQLLVSLMADLYAMTHPAHLVSWSDSVCRKTSPCPCEAPCASALGFPGQGAGA